MARVPLRSLARTRCESPYTSRTRTNAPGDAETAPAGASDRAVTFDACGATTGTAAVAGDVSSYFGAVMIDAAGGIALAGSAGAETGLAAPSSASACSALGAWCSTAAVSVAGEAEDDGPSTAWILSSVVDTAVAGGPSETCLVVSPSTVDGVVRGVGSFARAARNAASSAFTRCRRSTNTALRSSPI